MLRIYLNTAKRWQDEKGFDYYHEEKDTLYKDITKHNTINILDPVTRALCECIPWNKGTISGITKP